MKFKYETAVITMVQFIVLSLLGIANALNSIVSTCHSTHGDCVSNLIVSLIFFILTVVWFGFVWILGYNAQERRSHRLAWLLIAAEIFIAMIALFNAKHHTDMLGLGTSVVDLFLAIWVISLAFRLVRAGGGRVVTKQRPRQRRRHNP